MTSRANRKRSCLYRRLLSVEFLESRRLLATAIAFATYFDNHLDIIASGAGEATIDTANGVIRFNQGAVSVLGQQVAANQIRSITLETPDNTARSKGVRNQTPMRMSDGSAVVHVLLGRSLAEFACRADWEW